MRFAEIDVFGMYIAPISVIMIAAWIILAALRRVADRYALLRHVWHPALFMFSAYIIVLSCIVLFVGS